MKEIREALEQYTKLRNERKKCAGSGAGNVEYAIQVNETSVTATK